MVAAIAATRFVVDLCFFDISFWLAHTVVREALVNCEIDFGIERPV